MIGVTRAEYAAASALPWDAADLGHNTVFILSGAFPSHSAGAKVLRPLDRPAWCPCSPLGLSSGKGHTRKRTFGRIRIPQHRFSSSGRRHLA